MSQIEIQVLKQGTPSRNVVSCCFFTMGEAYRSFNQYTGNLKRFVMQSDKLRGFEIRIYTDDTGKDIALKVAEGKTKVSVLHYNCPQFREGKGHMGTFGMFVRFLPLFEDLDIAWVSDIDIPDHFLNMADVTNLIQHKCDVYISTTACYERKAWGRDYTIVAHKFMTRVQFPRALLTRYLNMITEGKLDEKIELINQNNQVSAHKPKPVSDFPYGLDELFLNTYIYNWIIGKNLRVNVSKDYGATWILSKLANKEEHKIILKHYYYPTKQTFLQLKRLVEKRDPPVELGEAACYKDLKTKLPMLKDTFVVDTIIEGKNL